MISEAKCVNKTCNICYEEIPSFHCSQCSFVICNTCKSAMSQLNVDNKCSQCRKEKPWLKAYELNQEMSPPVNSPNISVRTYQNKDCCESAIQYNIENQQIQPQISNTNIENKGLFEKLFEYFSKK